MPLRCGCGRRQFVESNMESPYDPQELKIQNLRKQIKILTPHFPQIKLQEHLFDESAYEGNNDYSDYDDCSYD